MAPRVKPADLGTASRLDLMPSTKTIHPSFYLSLLPSPRPSHHSPTPSCAYFVQQLNWLYSISRSVAIYLCTFKHTVAYFEHFTCSLLYLQTQMIMFYSHQGSVLILNKYLQRRVQEKGRLSRCIQARVPRPWGLLLLSLLTDGLPGQSYYPNVFSLS